MGKKLSTEEFIEKANIVHNNKFKYPNEYIGGKTPIKIECPIHGLFSQRPNDHLNGCGCAKCSGKYQLTTEEFIEKARLIHGDKYDYSLVDHKGCKTKVKIICPKHGVFEQTPADHLNQKQGCFKCGVEKRFLTKSEFIEKAKLIHGDKYDYSLSVYVDYKTKTKIICPKHGIFYKTPSAHIHGKEGCRACWKDENTLNLEKFINGSRLVHGDKYDYSLSDVVNSAVKTKIICPKHGVFEQRPNDHLIGNGCPICRESRGESKIGTFLKLNKIKYIRQFKFNDCRDKYPLPFDFYLPKYNTLIEYNGIQHYRYTPIFHRNVHGFEQQQKRDNIKINYCEINNINLLIIKYNDDINNKLSNLIAFDLK